MPERKAVLVTGAPRSGTTTAARYYQGQGLDVRHERMGADGASSFYWFCDHAVPQSAHLGRRSAYAFDRTIMLVREPLASINSLADLVWQGPTWFRARLAPAFGYDLPQDPILAAARLWLLFQYHTEADEVHRLEDWPTSIHAGRHRGQRPDGTPRFRLTWADLFERGPDTAAEVERLAALYGYDRPSRALRG